MGKLRFGSSFGNCRLETFACNLWLGNCSLGAPLGSLRLGMVAWEPSLRNCASLLELGSRMMHTSVRKMHLTPCRDHHPVCLSLRCHKTEHIAWSSISSWFLSSSACFSRHPRPPNTPIYEGGGSRPLPSSHTCTFCVSASACPIIGS